MVAHAPGAQADLLVPATGDGLGVQHGRTICHHTDALAGRQALQAPRRGYSPQDLPAMLGESPQANRRLVLMICGSVVRTSEAAKLFPGSPEACAHATWEAREGYLLAL